MPRVSAAEYPYTPFPTVETPSGTDALNSAYQRIQTTPGMFGGLTAEALQQLSGQLEKSGTSLQGAAIETQNLHNQVVVDQQISSYEDKVNKVLYGDPAVPGDTGYMGLRGQAALDARAGLNARLEQLTNDHAAVLQNTQQRLHFANQSRRYRNYMQGEIGKHYEAEYTRNAAQVMEGRANTSLGNAGIAANNDDFAAWTSAWGTGRAALQDSMNLPGRQLPPELQETKLREYDEKAIGDWAQKLAVRDPLKADQFLDANRDYLPTQYDNLKRSVKAEHDKALSNAIATGAPIPSGPVNLVPRPAAPASFRSGVSAQLLSKYAVDNAVVGGPSGVEGVNPEFAQRIDNMAQAMPDNIRQKFQIISGYRSTERQAQVNPAVKDSKHTSEGPGTGYAVDTTTDPEVIDWINKNGRRFGVDYTIRHLPGEENHLEMLGPDGGRMRRAGAAPTNNPGNIRSSAGGFQSYGSPEEGVRAISGQLDRYAAGGFTTATNPQGAPINTLRQIVSVWSPPSDNNNTSVLIDQAAKVTGFGPDQVLDMKDPATKAKVVEAIIRNEQGSLPVSRDVIRRAAGSGGGIPASILDEGAGGGDAPDTLVRNLPEPEAGTLPDSELGAAYQQRIEAAAKRVPPGTSIEVWYNAVRQIRREMSWQISMQRRDAQAAEQRAKAAMHDAENQIYRDVYSPYPKITPQQIATDPRFDIDPTRRRQMLELVNNPPGSSVPPAQSWAAAQSLIERIRLPEGTSGKITDTGQIYDNMRLLNKSDFEFVMKQFNDIRAPGGQTLSRLRDDFVKRYSGFITKSNPMAGLVDAVGEARLYEFERYIDQKVDEYKKAGKDPTVLFTDTGSPTFLGHESVIRQFQPTPEQSRQAVSGSVQGEVVPLPPLNRPAPPPPPPIEPRRLPGGGMEVPIPPPPDSDAMRRPDESPDQYLQRRQAQ